MSYSLVLQNRSYTNYLQAKVTAEEMAENNKAQIAAIEQTGKSIIAAQVASTAVLHRGLENLGYVTEAGFNKVSQGLDNVSRQIGDMGAIMDTRLAGIESAVQRSSAEICKRLDAISDFLKNKNQTEAREFYERSLTNYIKGFYEEALKYVKECLKIINEDYIAWFLLGKIYLFGAGEFGTVVDLDEAVTALEQAEKYIRPDSRNIPEAKRLASEVLYYLALAKETRAYSLMHDGDKEGAVKLLPEAAKNYTESYACSKSMLESKYNEARCYVFLNKTYEAVKCLEEIIRKDPLYSLKVVLDADFNSIQSAFTLLMEDLRSEFLSSSLQPVLTAYFRQLAEAHELRMPNIKTPENWCSMEEATNNLKDVPYIDMVDFCNNFSTLNHSFEQAIASVRAEKEQNEPKYRNLAASLSEIKAQPIKKDFSYTDYTGKIAELDKIEQEFKSLPSSFDVEPSIQECETCRKQYEEEFARSIKKKNNQSICVCIVGGIIGTAAGIIGCGVIGGILGGVIGVVGGIIGIFIILGGLGLSLDGSESKNWFLLGIPGGIIGGILGGKLGFGILLGIICGISLIAMIGGIIDTFTQKAKSLR